MIKGSTNDCSISIFYEKKERQWLGSAVVLGIWSSICSLKSFHKSNVSDLPEENVKKGRALRFKVLLWVG